MTDTVVLATRNAHKLREFGRLLAPAGIAVEPLPADVVLPPEDGDTFLANALGKARAAAAATGRDVLADDSGIEAEALGGAPGVRSARYAGEGASDEANLEQLMREAPAGSGLRYVCALVHVAAGSGEETTFLGECRGRMAARPSGSGGFGYDPAFVPDRAPDRTMADMSDAEKDAISHRGEAVRAFVRWRGE